MKKLLCLIAGLLFLYSAFSQVMDFSGDTSVYATYAHENKSFVNSQDTESFDSTNMIALENVAFRFSPVQDFSVWLDASCYGSLMHFKNNDIPIYVPFTLDINQIYIKSDSGSNYSFIGKKVFNYGLSSNFPLVNLINQRRDDAVRLVSEGTGAVGGVFSLLDWTSFSSVIYFNSDDVVGTLDDISFVFITDFFYRNFTLSIYSYYQNFVDSSMIDLFFSDYNRFVEEGINAWDVELPAAFSGAAQLGFFTLYFEILYKPAPVKFNIVKDSDELDKLEKVESGNYWDAMAGCRFVSSKLSLELEYCRAKSGYNVDEIEKIQTYLADTPLEVNRVYNSTRMLFRENVVLSVGYMLTPELTLSISDKITFPEFGCKAKYIGNRISGGFKFVKNQVLETMGSFSYSFGGSSSEFVYYNSNNMSITFGVKLYY